MAPPTFADLGKSAKDLFSKGYNPGLIKIESTTHSGDSKEVEFKTTASHNNVIGKLAGNLDIKYKIPQHGLTLTEKWNTDNQLGTVIEVNEQFGRGLKLTLDSTYTPHAGKRSGKLKVDWSHPTARVTADVGLTAGPLVDAAAVFARQGWLLGLQASFDVASNKLTGTNLAFGHTTDSYTIHSFVRNSNTFGASFFHKVGRGLEVGAQLGWATGNTSATYDLATKYVAADDLILRAKVNHESQVTVAATHAVSNALKLTLTSQFSLTQADAHKLGVGIEFTP